MTATENIIAQAKAAARLGSKVTDLPRYVNRGYTGGYDIYIDGQSIGRVDNASAKQIREFVSGLRKLTLDLTLGGVRHTVNIGEMTERHVSALTAADVAAQINKQIDGVIASVINDTVTITSKP